jgi:hypothetical protein
MEKHMFTRKYAFLACFAAALWVRTPGLRAQAVYGGIIGTVTDKTGAVVPAANATITDTGKG